MNMNSRLDWEIIEAYLKKQLQNTTTIMTFGTIGSKNIEHDIDIIVTKNPGAKSSNYYRELHKIFDNLNSYLRNLGSKLIVFSEFNSQDERLTIGNYKMGDIALHVMSYLSLEQLVENWKQDLELGTKIGHIIKNNYNPIKGSPEDIFDKKFFERKKHDNLILRMHNQDRTNSNYPESLLVHNMSHLYRYVLKHLGITENPVLGNRDQVREKFYNILDIIDQKNSENS